MVHTRKSRYRRPRRGMILLVVLALLTLFAVVGVTFVFVANAQEQAARIAREGETQFKPAIDAEAAMAFALGQLIYDVNDDLAGVKSALRGHSFARNMYGWYPSVPGAAAGSALPLNDKPYSGSGRQHISPPSSSFPALANFWTTVVRPPHPAPPQTVQSEAALVNYQYFTGNPNDANPITSLNDGFLRDPERISFRTSVSNPLGDYVNFSVPYTYPDHNNLFLAQFDHNTGEIVMPSFHREYLFGSLDASNPNWNSDQAKYLTLRPTNAYHPNFPKPIDRGGDVKNLDNAPGGADSIWIDVGAPVMTAPDGRKYKMLVAPLILDLDSRMNLNVVGNWLGRNSTTASVREHRSNQGWGPWEVNPRFVLNDGYPNAMPTTDFEWINIFQGSDAPTSGTPLPPPPAGFARVRGRYDQNQVRGINGTPLGGGGTSPRGWSQVDWNGCDDGPSKAQSTPYSLASTFTGPSPAPMTAVNSYFPFPTFPSACFGNGGSENTDHPAMWKAIDPQSGKANPDNNPGSNRAFPIHMLARMLRGGAGPLSGGGTGSDLLNQDLRRLLPNNLANLKRRNLVTLASGDLDRPGIPPYVWNAQASDPPPPMPDATTEWANQATTRFRLALDSDGVPGPRIDAATPLADIPFPKNSSRGSTPDAFASEFEKIGTTATWRSNLARMLRLRLNRPLPEYYIQPPGDPPPAPVSNFVNATKAREALASEIYNILRRVTGAYPTTDSAGNPTFSDVVPQPMNTLPTSSPEFQALRYLAQLAVNIVDYIDSDHVSTPFQWITVQGMDPMGNTITNRHWVYGFELPRLVINEFYIQYDNEVNSAPGGTLDTTKNYDVNIWLELMNPMPDDGVLNKNNEKDVIAKLRKGTAPNKEAVYRVRVASAVDRDTMTALTNPANTLGDPDYVPSNTTLAATRVLTEVRDWGDQTTAPDTVSPLPAANRFDDGSPATRNNGFYVAAPTIDFLDATQDDPMLPFSVKVPTVPAAGAVPRQGLNYKIPITPPVAGTPDPDTNEPRPIILLQRLANPDAPYDPNELDGMGNRNWNYNPYVTVDQVVTKPDPAMLPPDPLPVPPPPTGNIPEVMDGRRIVKSGPNPSPPYVAMTSRTSFGRRQPFAAAETERRAAAPAPALMTGPQHTFFRQNSTVATKALLDALTTDSTTMFDSPDSTLKVPFDWLVHLDRYLINPMELLHVSAFRPAEVLKYFVVDNQSATPPPYPKPPPAPATKPTRLNAHVVPWYNSSARLYRFFEFCSTATEPRNLWGAPNGRIPGKVNINTLSKTNLAANDPDLWAALCDPEGGNIFSATDADNLMANSTNTNGWLDQRTPVYNDPSDAYLNGKRVAGPTDELLLAWGNNPFNTMPPPTPKWTLNRPFWGFGLGAYTNPPPSPQSPDSMLRGTRGVGNSFVRTVAGTTDQQFDVPNPTTPPGMPPLHPYQRKELLTKIYNSITTRSNVFAVWLTIGFFEIDKDPATGAYRDNWNPPPLAAEIGKAENRHVRYRMFAIVDRTQLQVWPTMDFNNPTVAAVRAKVANPMDPADQQRSVKMPAGHPTDANGNPAAPFANDILLIGSTGADLGTLPNPPAFTDAPWRSNRTWTLQDGAVLVYEPGTDNEETVVARPKAGGGGLFEASFLREHPVNCTVLSRGNPGPWKRYDPRKDADVVPYFQLLD